MAKIRKLLAIKLSKQSAKPIHSVDDLLDFKKNRLKNNIDFFGVYQNDEMLSAGMMFEFSDTKIAHAQNLVCNPFEHYEKIDPITFLYYSVIKHYKEIGFSKLSWGVSTEDNGNALNFSLIKNKESYGSSYSVKKTYLKTL